MKKAFVFLLALLMTVSITACGRPASSDAESSSMVAIEAYIDQVMQTQEMQDSIEYCKANNMDHQLEARKDTLVYKYTYTVAVSASAKELLNAQYDSLKDVLASLAEVVKKEEPAIKTVIWEYWSIDGELLASFSS